MLADELGYVEGYAGDHVTDQCENITSCATFLATLVDRVKRMRRIDSNYDLGRRSMILLAEKVMPMVNGAL